MANSKILEPVSEGDPCGPDMRYDAEYLSLISALQESDDEDEGELSEGGRINRSAIIGRAETMLTKTKDLGIAAMRAEASWQDGGLVDFAEAMEDLVAMAEAWADGATGIHPRADEEDGDLGERAAPVGRLLNAIPLMVRTIGWGGQPEISKRNETHEKLKGVFDTWTERMGPALGDALPNAVQVWAAIKEITAAATAADPAADAGAAPAAPGAPAAAAAVPAGADAWDLIERAAESMARQDRHSPALPVLRMIATWRSKGIGDIARIMKTSGVGLELLLESIERQEAAESGGHGMP